MPQNELRTTSTWPPGGLNADPGVYGNSPPGVTVAQVGFDDNQGHYVTGDGTFTDYYIESRYEGDYHRYMAGVTSPGGFNGGTAAFFQLAAPTLLWIVEWTAAKWEAQPEVPDPNIATASDWVLLDAWFTTAMLLPDGSGNKALYRISGTYVYGCVAPDANFVNNVSFPRQPMWDDVFDRTMPASKLQQNLTLPNQQLNRVGNAGNAQGGIQGGVGGLGVLKPPS